VKKWALIIVVLTLVSLAFTRHLPLDKPARAGDSRDAARAGPAGDAA